MTPRTGIVTFLLMASALALAAGCRQPTSDKAVFELTEASVFDVTPFVRGEVSQCSDTPDGKVRYPKLSSAKPIYGSVTFAPRNNKSARPYHFVIDETAGTGKGYDRLYFDLNADGDLRNDAPCPVWKTPPAGAKRVWVGYRLVSFEPMKVPLDLGWGHGGQIASVMPRLILPTGDTAGSPAVAFIHTTARKGRIAIAAHPYDVALFEEYSCTGRLDKPYTAVNLTPVGGSTEDWWGASSPNGMHKVDGAWYRLSVLTPGGDKVTVTRYQGPVGVLRAGAGGRKVKDVTLNGSLYGKDMAVAAGADNLKEGWPRPARECTLPAGDYCPAILTVQMDKLRITVSNNYHADGKPRAERTPRYAIRIRQDRPFVLDFTNKPEVLFAGPAKGQRYKPGDKVSVAAVLIDPKLDIMIRNLDDTSRTKKQTGTWEGKEYSFDRPVSLDPKVTITDSAGKVVAEGVMPFG